MARLITFGCSYTYGHYLELDQKAPSPLAWPSLLGMLLGIKVINNAIPGASNLEILLSIFKFKFLKDDVVVVGWTHPFRDFLIQQRKQIGPWTTEVESLGNLYSNKDMAVRSGLYISHAELYLASNNLKQQHFFAPKTYTVIEFIHQVVKPNPVVKLKYYTDDIIIPDKDTALDNKHPGPKSHSIASKRLYELLK
jgi:hypothetical protein